MNTIEKALKALRIRKHGVVISPSRTSLSLFTSLQAAFPSLIQDDDFFSLLRRKKDKHEIAMIQKASLIAQEVIEEAFAFCTKGVSEKDVAFYIKRGFLERGADISFEPIVAFGKNSACPHWQPSGELLRTQEIVLIDCGGLVDHYASDMTRVRFLKKPSKAIEEAYHAVKNAYEAAFQAARPGINCADLHEIAFTSLKQAGLEHFFTHGLGHGVGLEVHEPPRLNKLSKNSTLQQGDVFTIEPGVYLPGIGGVRLENTLLMEEKGARSFMDMSLSPYVKEE